MNRQTKRAGYLLLIGWTIILVVSCQENKPSSASSQPSPSATAEASETPLSIPIQPLGGSIDRWDRLDTTGGGVQTAIATHPTDPNVVYMASDNGGLFKTENGGDSWFSVSSNLGAYRLGFVALDPLNPDVLYVTASTDYSLETEGGSTGEIFRSLNGGRSWEFISDAMGFQNSRPSQVSIVIPFDPAHPERFDGDRDRLSDAIVVGAWTGPADPPVGGIWRSEDEGQHFVHLALKDRNVTAVRSFPGNPDILFLTTYEGEVYRSPDSGISWVNVTGDLPLSHLSDLAVHPIDESTVYVTCRPCSRGEPPVWVTDDGGQTWHAASEGLDSSLVESFPRLWIDRFAPSTLYVTTDGAPPDKGGVYMTTDAGRNWYLMPARHILPDGRPYYWYQFEGGQAIGQVVDGTLFSGGGGGWRYRPPNSSESVRAWEPATIGVGNVQVNAIAIDPLNPAVLYEGISDFGPYKSVDGGRSFHRILGNGWPVTLDNYVWNGPYYSNYKRCQLMCSSQCQETGRGASGGTTAFAISRQDPNVVYSAFGSGSGRSDYGGVNKSTDGGQTWQPVGYQLDRGFELNPETCLPYGFRHLAIDPLDDNTLFAAMEIPSTGTGKLYRTIDGGQTWIEVATTSSFITGLEVSARDSNLVVFTTRQDVFKSEQKGDPDSWQAITPSRGDQIRTIALSLHNAQVSVVGTNDQGIYYTADGGATWDHNLLEDLFAQRVSEGSDRQLDPEVATAVNPSVHMLKNVMAVAFDPTIPDVFYIGGTRYTRASIGVARITDAGQHWQRLPLDGLSHRNIFVLTTDTSGEFLYAGTFDGIYRLRLREP